MRINVKATPINNNDYSFHIIAIELVLPIVSRHITPLVIKSLEGRHTHILMICTGSILRNQTRATATGRCAPGLKIRNYHPSKLIRYTIRTYLFVCETFSPQANCIIFYCKGYNVVSCDCTASEMNS